MASNAVNAVLDAEKSAKEQIEAAKTEAEEIIHRAKLDWEAEYERIISEAKDKKSVSVKAAQRNAEKDIEEARLTAQTEAQGIKNKYETMTDKAVEAILGIIS